MYKAKNKFYFLFYSLLMPFLVSCVSAGKYNSALDELARMRVDSAEFAMKLAESQYTKSKAMLETSKELRLKDQQLESMAEKISDYRELTTRLNEAIPKIENDQLRSYVDEGYLHITLPHRVLFNTGENELSEDGAEVIAQLSNELKNENADIMILGHTDSIPFGNSHKDNWELSFDRAYSVMLVMTANGFPEEHIILAGRGKYDPFLENTNQVGRLLNRRIELILMPDIDRIETVINDF